jgi:class 3 adenylate cyclase
VFLLLETVYGAFDVIAKRRGVFKVETIGDCYVAACGVPTPQKDHALIMARFARDILVKMQVLTQELEVALGPDTADLAFRIGLHSGPITGGVLRGDNARFQLFGDAMNTASRIESTGERQRVHISKQTADLLIGVGKKHWVKPRDEKIVAKGLGELETFWLVLGKERSEGTSLATSDALSVQSDGKPALEPIDSTASNLPCTKMTRLIGWNVDVLLRLLKQIAAARGGKPSKPYAEHVAKTSSKARLSMLDEVGEIIALPKFDAKKAEKQEDPDSIEIDEKVFAQLTSYVSTIASMYKDNPFHNFEHASHVALSVVKLLSRIVGPSDINCDDKGNVHASTLHDHTYGITSDPLTQFACVFSALIHDVDHQGVPNTQLVAEKQDIAAFYEGRSVAEQNSVDLAWELLMGDSYADLRAAIYGNKCEKGRFRQLVVNSVMATDIMDKELKNDRNDRWSKAFTEHSAQESPANVVNRRATIVIEHLIQASDVAHTMQHWHVYRKWNERLFLELYKTYKDGRAATDPTEYWYKGELGFFDFYIIPLAKKLSECGVFGVSSDEYLNYATHNRQEWELKGREVIEKMKALVNAEE